jgi:hypothetical protein
MSMYNFILNEFSGKNFLINIFIIFLAIQQKDIKKIDSIICVVLIFLFKIIIYNLNKEFFTDSNYEPISYNYFLPHFYNNNIKRRSLSDNFKLYTSSETYNNNRLNEIKLYEPNDNTKYHKLNNQEKYIENKINYKKLGKNMITEIKKKPTIKNKKPLTVNKKKKLEKKSNNKNIKLEKDIKTKINKIPIIKNRKALKKNRKKNRKKNNIPIKKGVTINGNNNILKKELFTELELECKKEGYSSCEEKENECIKDGFINCDEREAEMRCIEEGYNSCKDKYTEHFTNNNLSCSCNCKKKN